MQRVGDNGLSTLFGNLRKQANNHSKEQYIRNISFKHIFFHLLEMRSIPIDNKIKEIYSNFLISGKRVSKGNLCLHLQKVLSGALYYQLLKEYEEPLIISCFYLIGDEGYAYLYQELPDELKTRIEIQARKDINKYLGVCFQRQMK